MITITLSSRSDFSKVFQLINSDLAPHEEIIYDLKEFSFFEPIDILLFTMAVIYFKNRNVKQRYSRPLRNNTRSYLSDIGLFEFCKTNYQEPNTIEGISSRSAMPLRRITPVTMNNYILRAQTYFTTHCPLKDLSFLNLTISELINNVKDHAQSPIDAYIFCQLYPRLNVIKVVVGDLGIGIPASVNTYRESRKEPPLSDTKAIIWAVEQNTSTKSHPHNRGKGLNNLFEFIKFNRSIINIYSNNGIFLATKDRTASFINNIRDFKGTIIQMEINIDNLPDISNIEDDFWEQAQF
jgi:hypothetical protein